ncbi:MAG: glycogen/starch synthase [Desulfobulbaceae bacterium]|nr:glycogen/starch synthase [Desulfobulbaceae bacterium]
MAQPGGSEAIKSVWMLTREYEGLAGAGGVKDVSRQLAGALAGSGRAVTVVMPLYGFMDPVKLGFKRLAGHALTVGMDYVGEERREAVTFWERRLEKVRIVLAEADRFREKLGVYTYTAAEEEANPFQVRGTGHYDYFAMNVLLQKAALDLMISLGERPDVIHCHDGHTALLPALIREREGYRAYFAKTGVVVTIHNAGRGYHQEVGDLPFAAAVTGLPVRVITANLLEGSFDPFLAGSAYAVLNTVSENYARELRESDDDELTGWLGHQLGLRGVILKGVTNGIDPAAFDPRQPKKLGLAAAYDPASGDLVGKHRCRIELVMELAAGTVKGVKQSGTLDQRPELPLFTLIGRLTAQKGVDKLLEALEHLLPLDPDFQVLILGSGDKEIEAGLVRLAGHKLNHGRVCVLRGYAEELAARIYAAGDFFVIPSRYEPCGLTDFIAQLFGAIPIVHHVGGLIKVRDGVTGLAYRDHSSAALMAAMQRGLQLFRQAPERMAAMQRTAVEEIAAKYTWETVMERYLELYGEARRLTA